MFQLILWNAIAVTRFMHTGLCWWNKMFSRQEKLSYSCCVHKKVVQENFLTAGFKAVKLRMNKIALACGSAMYSSVRALQSILAWPFCCHCVKKLFVWSAFSVNDVGKAFWLCNCGRSSGKTYSLIYLIIYLFIFCFFLVDKKLFFRCMVFTEQQKYHIHCKLSRMCHHDLVGILAFSQVSAAVTA